MKGYSILFHGLYGSQTPKIQRYYGAEDSLAREISREVNRPGFRDKSMLGRPRYQEKVRVQRAQSALRIKAGSIVTSEEVTAKRRQERKQFKLDRAKAIAAAAAEAEVAFSEGREAKSTIAIPSGATWKPDISSADVRDVHTPPVEDIEAEEVEEEEISDMEHLQLTLQEAFFLIWAFDCISILDPNTVSVASRRIFSIFNCILKE